MAGFGVERHILRGGFGETVSLPRAEFHVCGAAIPEACLSERTSRVLTKQRVGAAVQAVKAEKAAAEPPRLGKLRFRPEPVQVLLTEEITGSLRQLKPTPTLARDRW